jgi:hypothetical protein
MFPLLSQLFPFVDLRNQFHVDHVFPISRFTRKKLQKAGFAEDIIDTLSGHANELPNLQLLEGAINNEKRASMPGEWLRKYFPDLKTQQHYRDKQVLGDLPEDLDSFEAFYEARQARLRDMLTEMLCISPEPI